MAMFLANLEVVALSPNGVLGGSYALAAVDAPFVSFAAGAAVLFEDSDELAEDEEELEEDLEEELEDELEEEDDVLEEAPADEPELEPSSFTPLR